MQMGTWAEVAVITADHSLIIALGWSMRHVHHARKLTIALLTKLTSELQADIGSGEWFLFFSI